VGPVNVQLRKSKGEFFIFEINPRFSGTTPIRAALGVNEPDMMIKNLVLEKKIRSIKNKKSMMISRMFQEVYFPRKDFEELKKNREVVGKGRLVDYT
jgi:carbamoyl-phosphate synthase large subunit